MTSEEADQFVEMIDAAWKPEMTGAQRVLWREFVLDDEPHTAFETLSKLFKTETFRPAPPLYREAYRLRRRDRTAAAPASPEARDEQPGWVRGWRVAREQGDLRPWPEQEAGYRRLHEGWDGEGPSGYEWDEDAVMPFEERVRYMREAGVSM